MSAKYPHRYINLKRQQKQKKTKFTNQINSTKQINYLAVFLSTGQLFTGQETHKRHEKAEKTITHSQFFSVNHLLLLFFRVRKVQEENWRKTQEIVGNFILWTKKDEKSIWIYKLKWKEWW